jgi:hypothetical protein
MGIYGAAGTYNVKISPFQANQLTDGLIYKPAYSLSGGMHKTHPFRTIPSQLCPESAPEPSLQCPRYQSCYQQIIRLLR